MPNQSDLVEEALIGSILTHPGAVKEIKDQITADDFRWHPHRWAWEAILSLHERGESIDLITVTHELETHGKLNDYTSASGNLVQYAAVASLVANLPEIGHVETYARQVKDAASARQIMDALNDGAIKLGSASPDEALAFLEGEFSRIAQGIGVKGHQLKMAEDAIREAMQASESAATNGGSAISTGYPDLDRKLGGGFYADDLNIIAARSGEGKTAFMLSLLANMAVPCVRMGDIVKAGLFSLEMPVNQIVNRLMSQLTGIPAWRLRSGKLQDADEWNNYYNAADKVARSGLILDDTPSLSIPQLRVKVGKMVDLGARIIGIDQLSFLTDATTDHKAQEHVRLNIIAHKLKVVAREFGVCVLLNHQMNRGIEGRPDYEDPTLADLEQAGDKPASVVMFIRHKRAGEVYQSSWIYLAKNRDGAAGVRVPLVFLADRTRFENAPQK